MNIHSNDGPPVGIVGRQKGADTMKKIKLANDMTITGWGRIAKGTAFKVQKFNKRFVYVEVADRVILRLARKRDCITVY